MLVLWYFQDLKVNNIFFFIRINTLIFYFVTMEIWGLNIGWDFTLELRFLKSACLVEYGWIMNGTVILFLASFYLYIYFFFFD